MRNRLAYIFCLLLLALPAPCVDAAKPARGIVERAGELVSEKHEKKWRLASPDKKHTLFFTLTEERGWSDIVGGTFEDKRSITAVIEAYGVAAKEIGTFDRVSAAIWSPSSDAFSIGGIGDDMRMVKIYVSENGIFHPKEVPYENPSLDADVGRHARVAESRENFAGWLKDGGFQTKQSVTVQFRSEDGSSLLKKGEVIDYLVTYSCPTSPDFSAKTAKLLKRKTQVF